ncbi:MAG TPA: DUF6551 family protein, partial [Solirubrobacteraceae bacterium]|nr:DUF6551 family protein [Solirubrobacteraceae bacterium]
QRPLTNFLKRIVARYDPAMIGTLIVSERPSRKKARYAVIDGQTRLEGMRHHDEPVAPCVVYTGLTREQEAQLFARFVVERRGMATYLRFRSALVANDEEAQGIAEIVRTQGFKVAGDGDAIGIKSIAALEWVYRRDPDLLHTVLFVIGDAWPMANGDTDPGERTRGEILKGIARFLREQDADPDKLAKRLKSVTPAQLRHRANALREGSGSSGSFDRHVRDALLGIYTRGRS